jgi:hypothetical protein
VPWTEISVVADFGPVWLEAEIKPYKGTICQSFRDCRDICPTRRDTSGTSTLTLKRLGTPNMEGNDKNLAGNRWVPKLLADACARVVQVFEPPDTQNLQICDNKIL